MESKLVIFGLAVVAFTLYKLVNKLLADRRYDALAATLGCQAPARLPQLPLGFDLVYGLFRADSKRLIPEHLQERVVRASANTYSYEFLRTVTIFSNEPKNIQAILSTQFQDFGLGPTRRNNFLPLLGHGIFTEDGKEWERSRAMLRPHFSKSQISDLRLQEVHVQDLLRALPLDESGWTAQVDLQILFFRMTLDSATEFLVGKSVNCQNASLGENAARSSNGSVTDEIQFGTAFDTSVNWLAKRARMNDAYWLIDGKEFREKCQQTHRYVDNLVEKALGQELQDTATEKKHNFLDSLLKQTSDRVSIRSELINILLASRDTTAATLGWLFHLLVRHPDVYAELRKTILEDFGSYHHPKDISLGRIKDSQYLQNCLHETLRLYPPVPVNSRQALRDTTIPCGGGPDGMAKVFVRKDQQVNYSVFALHRRKDLWGPDADEFKPERWTGRKSGWEYLPFNGGPRVCLGRECLPQATTYRSSHPRLIDYYTQNNLH